MYHHSEYVLEVSKTPQIIHALAPQWSRDLTQNVPFSSASAIRHKWANMGSKGHALSRICKLRSAGKAYVQHTWTRPAGSMRWTDKQQAVPALLPCHRLTTCTKGDTHTHSIPFAHILQSLHVLVRPAIARHHPAPVHHVGAFLVPRIDTWYHQAHQAASSSRRRPGLNEMPESSLAQTPHR